ncbi:hypothetical protein JKG47_04395 [Acidithiobacillus sp. MC6.1]|nr:hypothetical protein [Acidithiobacillus sp. MC6.1]
MRTIAGIYGFQTLGLRGLIAAHWQQLQQKKLRHQGVQGILVNADSSWRYWAESLGLQNMDPADAPVSGEGLNVDLWIIGRQAQQQYPPEFWSRLPGDWLLLGSDLPELEGWIGRAILPDPKPRMGFFCLRGNF